MYVKTFRLVHTFYTQNAFVILLGHECLRVTQTFCTKMFVNEKYNIFTHTLLYTHTSYTFYTHKYKTKMSSESNRRHFVTRAYFRVRATQIIQKLFTDNTGKWLSGIRFVFQSKIVRSG